MCGRYSLALWPSQVRAYLEDDSMPVNDAPGDDDDHAPRQSYNFAPGYHGIVYRADTPDRGAGSGQHKDGAAQTDEEAVAEITDGEVQYRLQSMKWGLIPFWTKRNPDYGSMMKTINCRDDSLIENKGMWTTMKQKKRCVVIAQGFYEWLKKGKDKLPHYTKRKDGKLMCLAGLWDCVQYEGYDEKHYTYTIITTDSNKQLKFLHDRMPVILDNGSEELRTWLDPKRSTWSKELQSLLKPYDGELEIYPVSKDVGKVGNNSPNFIIPITSSENKSNIANFFGKLAAKGESKAKPKTAISNPSNVLSDEYGKGIDSKNEVDDGKDVEREKNETRETIDHGWSEDHAPLPVPQEEMKKGIKRELDDVPDNELPNKMLMSSKSRSKEAPEKPSRKTRSATSNNTARPPKATSKGKGSQKITSFFGK